MRRGRSWTYCALIAVVAAGCGSSNPAGSSTTASSDPGSSTSAVGTVPTDPTPAVTEVDIEVGPGTFFMTDPSTGFEALSAYTATMTVSFEGTRDGAPYSWSSTRTLTKAPDARRLALETEGVLPDRWQTAGTDDDELTADEIEGRTTVLMAEVADSFFRLLLDGRCIIDPTGDEASALLDLHSPTDMLPPLLGAEEAGHELIDGIDVDHYTFDQRALVEAVETSGDIWVASDGGAVVRFVSTTTGDEDYFGEGVAGTLSREFILSDINATPDVALPDACLEGFLDMPLLPASNLYRAAGALSYQTTVGVDEAVAFYQESLSDLGWTSFVEPTVDGSTVVMQFMQGDQVLFVIVSEDAGITLVDMAVSPALNPDFNF